MAPSAWLNPGEEIVVHVRPHWSYLRRPLAAVILALVAAEVAVSHASSTVVDDALAVALVIAVVWLVIRYARWSTTVLVVTTDRLLQRRGAFGRRVRALPLAQVGRVEVRRPVRERLVGTGDLVVTSVDQGREVFERVPRPAAVARELRWQVERVQGAQPR